MKYIIITLIVLLVGCATKTPDIILTTRGHNEEVKKDPN